MIALVAHVARTAAGDTAAINTTGANLLIAHVTGYHSEPSLTDSKSNTWTRLAVFGDPCTTIYWCVPTSVGSGHTFTISGGVFPALHVSAWSGANASPYDKSGGVASGTQPGSLTPAVAGSLIVAGCNLGGQNAIPTINSGFTILDSEQGDGAFYFTGAVAYLIQGAAAAVNPTWSDTGALVMAVFKPVATTVAFDRSGGLIPRPLVGGGIVRGSIVGRSVVR